MKKILLFILLPTLLMSANLDIVMEKQTNGGYRYELPRWRGEIVTNKFVYRPELSLIFTSPRSGNIDPFKANHHSIDWNNNIGIEIDDVYITNSVGVIYIFEGNDDGLEEGVDFYNTLTIGFRY